jgi:hypothetical protein
MKVDRENLDLFALSYVEAMLWSTNDESDESGGDPMDSNYSVDDLDPDLIAEIVTDCAAFRAKFDDAFLRAACLGRYDAIEQAGHDFWLTRAGHGCGFWETSDWKEEAGAAMTAYCEEVGECYICIGDNGKVCS